MKEATYLAKLCSEVILVHRRPVFRASAIIVERARQNPRIKFMVPYETVDTTNDAGGLTGVIVRHEDTGKLEEVKLDGLFMAIGHVPNSGLFKDFLESDENGYLVVHNATDQSSSSHPKVAELRGLSLWSEGQVWVSPEMHGNVSGVMKN